MGPGDETPMLVECEWPEERHLWLLLREQQPICQPVLPSMGDMRKAMLPDASLAHDATLPHHLCRTTRT